VKLAAKIISYIFHPLMLTTYLVLVLGKYFPAALMIHGNKLYLVTALIFLFTFVFPVLNILIFRFFGTIQSLNMESRKERLTPFIFISIMYALITVLFYVKLPFSLTFIRLMAAITLLVFTGTIFTFFFKVSVHSLAAAGFVGILIPFAKVNSDLLWPTAVAISICGLVISSRLALNAHTPRETMIGSIAGFLVGYGAIILLFR
jgi:membrane-associated phospholipid phosphatase